MTSTAPAAPRRASGPRVVVVLGIVVALVGALAVASLLSDGVRRQASLSLSRHDPSYVALSFPLGDAVQSACATQGRRVRLVAFEARLHGEQTSVSYDVEVRRPGASAPLQSVHGTAHGRAGSSVAVSTRVTLPKLSRAILRSAYDVRIGVAGTRTQLIAHCPRPARN